MDSTVLVVTNTGHVRVSEGYDMKAAALSKVKAQVHIFSNYKESWCFSLKFAIASSPYRVL